MRTAIAMTKPRFEVDFILQEDILCFWRKKPIQGLYHASATLFYEGRKYIKLRLDVKVSSW